jgi:hypothetical protein
MQFMLYYNFVYSGIVVLLDVGAYNERRNLWFLQYVENHLPLRGPCNS